MALMRNVRVASYDPAWREAFEREAALLTGIFGTEIVALYHIGSTSVPALPAKPIIDIMPVMHEIARVDLYNDAMLAAGYEPHGEFGIPGRRYFSKGGDEDRTHHVHAFQIGNPGVARHLAFRDYLRAHADAAQEYADLKIALAHQFPHDIEGYMHGKNAFIKDLEQRALAWWTRPPELQI
jgi:GrpB-like predicted nucleotidyltransferase (UPF0157 family)